MSAFMAGMGKAKAAGLDLSKIRSVTSFFVSRVDTEVDKRLDKIGGDDAKALRGKAAIVNARLAYQAYEEVFGLGDRLVQRLDVALVVVNRPTDVEQQRVDAIDRPLPLDYSESMTYCIP
jgi:transaldolase